MNSKLTAWVATCIGAFLTALLACAAAVVIPKVLLTFTPTAPLVPVTGATPTALQPVATATSCPQGNGANACMARLSTIATTSGSSEARPKGPGLGPKGPQAAVLVTYPINGDQLGSPSYSDLVPPSLSGLQHDTQAQVNIWDYFAAIIPADQRAELSYYVVASDGRGGMLASVEQFSGQADAWAMVVDPADAGKPRDLTFTLLHEFGHLLTLNSTQVQPDQAVLQNPGDVTVSAHEAASCPRYFASGGCSLPNSYINQFYDQFWSRIYGQWSTVNEAKDLPNYMLLLARFYHDHANQFITPYASTSPEEDMAETWSYFVLNPKPAADSIAHEKVLFFYGYPELVSLREQIVSNICKFASTQ